eukprot:2477422-Pyramimonas_sp.AAC.1
MAVSASASHTQVNASWPHGELNRRLQWRCPRAFPPPSTAPRGPIGSSTEGSSGCVRMRLLHP